MPVIPAAPVAPAAAPEPIMSWLTSPLLLNATSSKARRGGYSHRRRAKGGHRLPPHGGGVTAPAAPTPRGPSAAPTKLAPCGPSPRGGPRLSATVTVPATHAAWLTGAARRWNDGTGAVAVNKTARNAVEYAQATLSVKDVLAAAAAREPDTSRSRSRSGDGSSGGHGSAGGGPDGGSDTDASVSGADEAAPPAAPPAARLTVRLASAPLRFLEEVADAAGAGGCRCSVALGLVLAAVRQVGSDDVFTRRWGEGCNTASIYADVGVYAQRGRGVLW